MLFVISFVLGLLVGIVFGAGSAATGSEGLALAGLFLNALLAFVIYAAYTGALMGSSGDPQGADAGYAGALNIRVVRTDRQPVRVGTVAIRQWLMQYFVFGFLAIVTLFIATLLNYLWPLWDNENRALHDMVASTRVVNA